MNPSRGYDQLARVYRLIELAAFGRALERARFRYFEQLHDRRRILLLGDGDGRGLALACRVAPQARITSLDFSPGMINRATRRLSPADRARVTFICADALTAEFSANTYDAVTTLFFLDCFSPDQVRGFIDRVQPALAAGALWLHADFNLPPRGFPRLHARAWLALMFRFFRWQTGLATHALPPSEELLKGAGFTRLSRTAWQNEFLISAVYAKPHLSLNK